MANVKIDLLKGAKALLNGVELLNDKSKFPHVPTTLPLKWDSSDHTIAEFLEANADKTQIQVKGLKVGVATITLTDGLLTTALLDINVIAAPVVVPLAAKIQVLELPVNSGDPYAK